MARKKQDPKHVSGEAEPAAAPPAAPPPEPAAGPEPEETPSVLRVVLVKLQAGPDGIKTPGTILEVPFKEAEALMADRAAVPYREVPEFSGPLGPETRGSRSPGHRRAGAANDGVEKHLPRE